MSQRFPCKSCGGSGCETDDNGVQHDEPCGECLEDGFDDNDEVLRVLGELDAAAEAWLRGESE